MRSSRDDLMARARCCKCGHPGHMSGTYRSQTSSAGRLSGSSKFGTNFLVQFDVGESSLGQVFERLNLMAIEHASGVLRRGRRRRRRPGIFQGEASLLMRRHPETFEQTMATQESPNVLVMWAQMGVSDIGAVTGMVGLTQFASYCEGIALPSRGIGGAWTRRRRRSCYPLVSLAAVRLAFVATSRGYIRASARTRPRTWSSSPQVTVWST